jgi:hypothetical protein
VSAASRAITDREWAETKFRGLLEATPDAIVGVDTHGRIVLMNAQAERLFGYSRDELVGEAMDVLVPEHSRSIHPSCRASYFAHPAPRPMGAGLQLAARRRDGTDFPAEISLSAIDTEDGLLVTATIRDVTERRRAAEVEVQLAAIVRSSHDAIIGEDLDGTVTSWNPGAELLYGYRAAEIVGANVELLIPTESRAEETEILARIARGERIEQYQPKRVRKDGTTVRVSVTVSPMADASGQIVGAARISRDVTDRQRAEAIFRGLLEAASDAIVGVDRHGTIAMVNTQAERLFGYARHELEGQPVEILVPEAARAVHPSHRSAFFANPTPRPMSAAMQLAGRRKDGTEFPAEISLSSLETEEGLLVSAAVRDVTERIEAQAERERLTARAERVRLESQLHQSQRLESLGQLAGGVAHDFNNLLGVIINYTSFVGDEIAEAAIADPSRDWAAVGRDVAQIQLASDRAAQLTHQLLAFARREVVHPQVLIVNDVLDGLEQLLRRTIGEHVVLEISPGADLWPVFADKGQVEQVLVNLAVNARDAMPNGGRLTIDTSNVNIDQSSASVNPGVGPARHVRLRISDTGTGMDSDTVERAFEPFFTTHPKGEGAGLGLATVYGIINQAGGVAHIDSEPGFGTTFTALLPATEETARTPEPERLDDTRYV